MCLPGLPPAPPATAGEALSAISAGLSYLNEAGTASLTSADQADCLRALEQAAAMHTAARARLLAAFHDRGGCEDDGHGSTRTWLKWQTRITGGAAAGALGWMRRLSAHPAVGDALAGAEISESWARQICDWTERLPEQHRAAADTILLGAAAGGARLRDLEGLAEQIRQRTARPDADEDDGFDDRSLRLATTFRGAGKLHGDLTPQCAAALAAVLEALGKRAGPEDLRSKRQRDHDALEEAMRRLIAAGCLPERAGQPTQIQLHLTLDQLRGLPGAAAAEAAWAGRLRPARVMTAMPPSSRSPPATSTPTSWTASPPHYRPDEAPRPAARAAWTAETALTAPAIRAGRTTRPTWRGAGWPGRPPGRSCSLTRPT